jgi:hypothetical protein
MKISVELSDSELKEICRFTGEKKKGPAIRKVVVDALRLQRRQDFVNEVLAGKFYVDLSDVEKARAKDRRDSRKLAKALSK